MWIRYVTGLGFTAAASGRFYPFGLRVMRYLGDARAKGNYYAYIIRLQTTNKIIGTGTNVVTKIAF